MKKLLLVTGIFLSIGLMASAQEKKSTTPATTTQTPKKKKTMSDSKQEKTAKKMETEKANGSAGAVKKGSTSPLSKETKSN